MTKHTPGPWTVSNESLHVGVRVENGSIDSIAQLGHSCYPEALDANAKLIAAAPELLEVLRKAYRIMSTHEDYLPGSAWAETMNELSAIIVRIDGN